MRKLTADEVLDCIDRITWNDALLAGWGRKLLDEEDEKELLKSYATTTFERGVRRGIQAIVAQIKALQETTTGRAGMMVETFSLYVENQVDRGTMNIPIDKRAVFEFAGHRGDIEDNSVFENAQIGEKLLPDGSKVCGKWIKMENEESWLYRMEPGFEIWRRLEIF